MEYRAKTQFDLVSWLLLNGLVWVGVICIGWELFRPGGWMFQALDFFMRNQPAGCYYLGVGILGILAAKVWLDGIDPRASRHLLTAVCAFAGTLFILNLLLPL